jgi:hypothetical protein
MVILRGLSAFSRYPAIVLVNIFSYTFCSTRKEVNVDILNETSYIFVGDEYANKGEGITTIGAWAVGVGVYCEQKFDNVFLTIEMTELNCVMVTL